MSAAVADSTAPSIDGNNAIYPSSYHRGMNQDGRPAETSLSSSNNTGPYLNSSSSPRLKSSSVGTVRTFGSAARKPTASRHYLHPINTSEQPVSSLSSPSKRPIHHQHHLLSPSSSVYNVDADLSTHSVPSLQHNRDFFGAVYHLVDRLLPSHARRRFEPSNQLKFILNCCLWYVASSLTNNTGKQILNVFRFPVTLTFIQFGLVAVCCWTAARLFGATHIRAPTVDIARTIVPLAVFLIVGHVFSSIAISRIPVSMVHTIKALAPLFTVLFYRFIFQVSYTRHVYVSLLPLTLGVILACSFTFTNNTAGLLCALGSCLVFVTQNIFSKKILFKESKLGDRNPNKLDKMNVLFYSSSISFLLMVPLWFYSDGQGLRSNDMVAEISLPRLIYYFVLNGTMNFGQNWFAFTTLSLTSPVTYSILSLLKRIFVIVMSIVWFGQQVSWTQSFGILLTFVGLYLYQQAKQDVDRGEREKSVEMLPTSLGPDSIKNL